MARVLCKAKAASAPRSSVFHGVVLGVYCRSVVVTSWTAQQVAAHHAAIHRVVRVVVLLAGRFDRALEAGALRALVAVHKHGDVPRVLLAERATLAQRHVGPDEAGRVGELVHAGPQLKDCAPHSGGNTWCSPLR